MDFSTVCRARLEVGIRMVTRQRAGAYAPARCAVYQEQVQHSALAIHHVASITALSLMKEGAATP